MDNTKELTLSIKRLRKSLSKLTPKELKKLDKLFVECDKFADAMIYYTPEPYSEDESSLI